MILAQQKNDIGYSQRSRSIAIKILINYLQMINIVTTFNLQWPYYAREYLTDQGSIALISTRFFSLECIEQCFFFRN